MKYKIVEQGEYYCTCSQCGLIADTRPYGLNHEEICWDCSQKDPSLTEIRGNEIYFGEVDG